MNRFFARLQTAAILTCMVMVGLPASADSLDDLAALVRDGLDANLDYRSAADDLSDAQSNRAGTPFWEDLSISGSATYNYDASPLPTKSPSEVGGSLSLQAPILDQVTLKTSAQYSLSGGTTGSLGVSVDPFAIDSQRTQNEETYLSARLAWEVKTLSLPYDTEEALLSAAAASAAVDLAEKQLALQGDLYEIATQEHKLGELSYLDLDDAAKTLDGARKTWSDASRTLLSRQRDLSNLFILADETPTPPKLDADWLEQLVQAKHDALDALSENQSPWSENLDSLQNTLWSLRQQQSDTWVWRPSLTIEGSTAWDLSSASASLRLNFSPSDLAYDERDTIQSKISDTLVRIDAEKRSLATEERILERGLDLAEQGLSIAQADLESSRVSQEEAKVLHDRGEESDLDLRQVQITYQERTKAYLDALMSENSALNALLKLYQEPYPLF